MGSRIPCCWPPRRRTILSSSSFSPSVYNAQVMNFPCPSPAVTILLFAAQVGLDLRRPTVGPASMIEY
jgi:hypothetical protein